MTKRTQFNPAPGKTYTNQGGGTYICLDAHGDYLATMQNTASGWTFIAHGCGVYEDGTIDWDRSTGGHFAHV